MMDLNLLQVIGVSKCEMTQYANNLLFVNLRQAVVTK